MRIARIGALIIAIRALAADGAESELPVFTDVTRAAGIRARHCFGDFELTNIVEGTGSGAMFFDYDGDGWLDVYFVNGCWLKDVNDNRGRKLRGKLSNSLYRNNRDGTFTEVTKQAGVGDRGFGFGCSAADFDGDGDLDLYVLNYGPTSSTATTATAPLPTSPSSPALPIHIGAFRPLGLTMITTGISTST